MQSKPEITPLITEVVVGLINDSENATRMDLETAALLTYVQHIFVMREVVKERK
jgi:hypothetical protein